MSKNVYNYFKSEVYFLFVSGSDSPYITYTAALPTDLTSEILISIIISTLCTPSSCDLSNSELFTHQALTDGKLTAMILVVFIVLAVGTIWKSTFTPRTRIEVADSGENFQFEFPATYICQTVCFIHL